MYTKELAGSNDGQTGRIAEKVKYGQKGPCLVCLATPGVKRYCMTSYDTASGGRLLKVTEYLQLLATL